MAPAGWRPAGARQANNYGIKPVDASSWTGKCGPTAAAEADVQLAVRLARLGWGSSGILLAPPPLEMRYGSQGGT